MQRWGHTATGKIRWFCKFCASSSTVCRLDTKQRWHVKLFKKWLTGTESLIALSARNGCTPQTSINRFADLWDKPPAPKFPQTLSATYIVLDALYLAGHHDCVLICRTGKGNVFWAFAEQETVSSWRNFLRQIPKPAAVVCDGQSGLLSSIQELWQDVPVQRCLAHIQRLAIQRLTSRPHTIAGQELLQLVYTLIKVKTVEERTDWFSGFKAWSERHCDFLKEQTQGVLPGGIVSYWYTHRRMRALKSTLSQSLSNLFVYIDCVGVPATTNLVEGGINSRLRELLHRHRGVSIQHKKVLIAYFLESLNQCKKPTRNFN